LEVIGELGDLFEVHLSGDGGFNMRLKIEHENLSPTTIGLTPFHFKGITLYTDFVNLSRNFHVPTTTPIIPELRKHLKGVIYEKNGIQAPVMSRTDFGAAVLWQPMVEETVSSYHLLKSMDKDLESVTIVKDCEQLISVLPTYLIATTIIFPTDGEVITIRRERYPRVL
jgi:hypothetical protein